jgi:hypothetical protein
MTVLRGRAHTGAIARFPSTIGPSPVDSCGIRWFAGALLSIGVSSIGP